MNSKLIGLFFFFVDSNRFFFFYFFLQKKIFLLNLQLLYFETLLSSTFCLKIHQIDRIETTFLLFIFFSLFSEFNTKVNNCLNSYTLSMHQP